jgi:nicotinamidase-related amidase
LINKTNQLVDFCRKNDYKIIFTTHIEKDSEDAFAENSENIKIIDEIEKKDLDVVIKKYKISPFFKTDLDAQLDGIEEIVVAGILTNLCVRSLVQDAYDRDFEITVIKDCCQALDIETHEFTLKDLKETREEIEILEVEEFIK